MNIILKYINAVTFAMQVCQKNIVFINDCISKIIIRFNFIILYRFYFFYLLFII